MNKGKKTQNMERWKEDYLRKLNFEDAKTIFELRSNMTRVKANFKNDHKGQIKCEFCKDKDETTQHIYECKEYEHIQKYIKIKNNVEETLRINNLAKLANITRKIMETRKEKLEIRRSQKDQPTTAPLCTGSSLPDGRR